jgi:hypothetical protein
MYVSSYLRTLTFRMLADIHAYQENVKFTEDGEKLVEGNDVE